MTDENDFPPDVAADIVAHMNEDHADAVLAIVRAQGGVPAAERARLLAITPHAIDIEIEIEPGRGPDDAVEGDTGGALDNASDVEPDGESGGGSGGHATGGTGHGTRFVTIAFDPPVDPLDTIRARLVAMTKAARAMLAASPQG